MRERRATGGAALLVALVAGHGCQVPPAANDPVILALGEREVRRSEFDAHVRRLESQGGLALGDDVRRAVLETFIDQRLLALEARRRGLVPSDASEADESAGVQQLLAAAVLSTIAISEEDIVAEYDRDRDAHARPEIRSVRQILVETLNEARDIRRRLQRDPKSFDLLARSHSRAPEAAAGGLMGRFARGELPPRLEQVVFALPVGRHSTIVETAFGFHVLRVDSIEPAGERSLEESRDEIQRRLFRRASDRKVREFVGALKAQAKVNHEAATRPVLDR